MPWMTIPIALALGAGGSTVTSYLGNRSASKQNERTLTAQQSEAAEERKLERDRLAAETERNNRSDEFNRSRWDDYMSVYRPRAQASQGMMQAIAQMMGVEMPAANFGSPTSRFTPPGPARTGDPSALPSRTRTPGNSLSEMMDGGVQRAQAPGADPLQNVQQMYSLAKMMEAA